MPLLLPNPSAAAAARVARARAAGCMRATPEADHEALAPAGRAWEGLAGAPHCMGLLFSMMMSRSVAVSCETAGAARGATAGSKGVTGAANGVAAWVAAALAVVAALVWLQCRRRTEARGAKG